MIETPSISSIRELLEDMLDFIEDNESDFNSFLYERYEDREEDE